MDKSRKKTTLNSSRLKIGVILAIIVIAVAVSGIYIYTNPVSDDSLDDNSGEDFVFTLLDGSKGQLSDYRGKVVILDMWAIWCQPCQFQMTELKKVYENYSRNDLEIISIDIDTRESSQQIQSFVEEFKNQLDIELDWIFGMDDGSIWEKYMLGQGGIPSLYIFDQEGQIHFSQEGVSVFSEIPQGWPEDITRLAPKIDELLN